MKRGLIAAVVLMLSAVCFCLPVYAEETYADVYEGAFQEAIERHEDMLYSEEIFDPYDAIGYVLADITGDGVYELIFRQVVGKHYAEHWVYGYDGSDYFYMGEFGNDAYLMYGFEGGVLYRENYKGSVTLGLAEWNGYEFVTTTLYQGEYDRDGEPPTVWELSNYYDPGRLMEEVPDFVPLDEEIPELWEPCGVPYDLPSGAHFEPVPEPDLPPDPEPEPDPGPDVPPVVIPDPPAASDGRFDLSNYGYRTVVTNNSKGALVFQSAPNGSFMFDYEFWNGDSIYVNLVWRQDGYAIAYKNGVYGYVDANYINWNTSVPVNDDRYNLSNYVYRTVVTDNSKGSLVFQSTPNGSFMLDYQFWNGDSIYVNLNWRQDGYAIAYKNGVYGYVDAKYINWNSGASASDDRYNMANYAYRTVKTDNSKGALVFQNSPNGSFMNNYQFWNGDSIYVNLYWRQDGYAIAYKNGVYGYVDAKYINW